VNNNNTPPVDNAGTSDIGAAMYIGVDASSEAAAILNTLPGASKYSTKSPSKATIVESNSRAVDSRDAVMKLIARLSRNTSIELPRSTGIVNTA
jgi:hypothetical protein